ncbi:hypothetical protein LguiB_001479 [Lonicera macranthoides]
MRQKLPHVVDYMNSGESTTSRWTDFLYISSSPFFPISPHHWRAFRERSEEGFEGKLRDISVYYSPPNHYHHHHLHHHLHLLLHPNPPWLGFWKLKLGIFAFTRFRLDSSAILRGIDPPKVMIYRLSPVVAYDTVINRVPEVKSSQRDFGAHSPETNDKSYYIQVSPISNGIVENVDEVQILHEICVKISKYLFDGNEGLLKILGPSIVSDHILPGLTALPDATIVLGNKKHRHLMAYIA